MEDYQRLYYILFNAITDAATDMEAQNYGLAYHRLLQAQADCEERFLAAEEEN